MQSGKMWTILSTLVFMMTCGLVVYATTSLTSSSSFSSWRTDTMGNTLTTGNWNALMDKLEGLDTTIESLSDTVDGLGDLDSIPVGAIMAFNLAECPCGWDDYDADGKFLMGGKTTNQTETGGAVDNHIHLRRQQLPKHSHTYIDTVFSEPEGIAGIKVGEDGIYDYLEVGHNDFGGIKVVGNWNEDDLYPYWYHPVFGFRKTTYSICDNTNPQVFLKRGEGAGGRGYNDGCNHASGYPEFVDITPAYVKVKYCVKNSESCDSSTTQSTITLDITTSGNGNGHICRGTSCAGYKSITVEKWSSISAKKENDIGVIRIGDITITAEPQYGSYFSQWNIKNCGANNNEVVEGCTISATFK